MNKKLDTISAAKRQIVKTNNNKAIQSNKLSKSNISQKTYHSMIQSQSGNLLNRNNHVF
jgi:hypothetical protein